MQTEDLERAKKKKKKKKMKKKIKIPKTDSREVLN